MPIEWKISDKPIAYPIALKEMEERVAKIIAGKAPEMVWLLEHEDVYTAGTGATDGDLLDATGIPVYKTGRGGKFTYHGPGQRVVYLMLDLKKRHAEPDVRKYVQQLEEMVIKTLAEFKIAGFIREGRVGVWVETPKGESKIAALGIRIKKWVTYHGISINLNPDLVKFSGIVPCGLSQSEFGVTSFADLGFETTMEELDAAFKNSFNKTFE